MIKINKLKFTIIIHGGAWDIPESAHKSHLAGVEKAARIGYDLLQSGETAIDTAIEVVRCLELDSTFDAGIGSFLNSDADVEMDAIIMEGKDLSSGAVAAIQNVLHPIEVANLVRVKTEHSLLVGKGATNFAHANGIKFCPTEVLLVGRELERYKELKKQKNIKTRQFFENTNGHDTVGAVVMDCKNNIVVATSTGGTPKKLPGRVGDSPLIGCGCYADNLSGGAAATGWGESLMKILLSKTAVDFMSKNLNAQEAADSSIDLLTKRVDGRGGVICIDRKGNPGFAYNTPFMARAIADQSGIKHAGI